MPALRKSRQEIYVQNWFKGETKERSAIIAGYQPKWARSIGSRLSTNPNIIARYNELQQKAEDASVATVLERKQVLTEIIRGRFADFMKNLTPEKLQSAALQEIRIVEFGPAGATKKATTIKLNDPAKAIDLLNKMDQLYAEGAIVNVDNRTLTIVGDLTDEQLAIIAAGGDTSINSSDGVTKEKASTK